MNIVVTLEHRYETTPGGEVWSPGPFAYRFWLRYLDVFDHVQVVARVRRVAAASPGWVRSDGLGVAFIPVTHYQGPWQYLLRKHRVRNDVRSAIGPSDAVILRVGSQVAACLEPQLHRSGRPYGVEVVGDPYDVFAPGAVVHPLRPFFRWWFPRQLRRQCAQACGALYVTDQALQRRYPCPTYATGVSDVELPQSAIVSKARSVDRQVRATKLIMVGTLEQLYKAPEILIDSLAICTQDRLDLVLTMVGDGKERPGLEARARALGLGSRVQFLGQLPAGEAVRSELDRADLFVLPSRQEGLPRAIIEAMARALPCISSTVGGIPELLEAEDLVPPGDALALARKIREVITDPERMERMSSRNLEKSHQFREDNLKQRRLVFYRYVKNQTEVWARSRSETTN